MNQKANAIIGNACENNSPIIFEKMSVKIFVKFLFAMAQQNGPGNKFLSKSGYGMYRSALKKLYRQCKQTMPASYETKLKIKFKGLLCSYAKEKERGSSI